MQKFYRKVGIIAAFMLLLPVSVMGATTATSKQKTLTGTVIKINGNQITFRTTSAATYTAETLTAKLVRKNGAAMAFNEILIGDKVEVKGNVWPDNSVNAITIRNMSLYVHNGTFTGKISSIDPNNSNFILESKTYGSQTIMTDSFTTFKKNSTASTFTDLLLGVSTTVKGAWDRDKTKVAAKSVVMTIRLINIDITGTLTAKTDGGYTVVDSGGVIYGVDVSKAKLQSKNSKTLADKEFYLGHQVRVQGKHISEGTKITASVVKNLSVTK